MHLSFAIPWGTSWKLFSMFFHMIWTHVWLSLFHCSWSFVCVLFHVITWLLSFLLSRLCLLCPCFKSFDPSTQCLLRWSRLWWCISPQKLFFCYHLPTRGRAGVKLEDAWYVSNVSIIFDALCLFLHHLLCVLLHFMAFYAFSRTNLLTRCHSASSLFSAVFVFQKSYTWNILSIGRNNNRTSQYLPKLLEVWRGDGEGPGANLTTKGRGPAPGRVHLWWGHPGPLLTPPLRL
jgi:hypothetical protein